MTGHLPTTPRVPRRKAVEKSFGSSRKGVFFTYDFLVLILAAIVYWQIKEIDRVLATRDPEEAGLNLELLAHISPIQWENVLLYGEYTLDRSRVRRSPGGRTAP